MPDVRSHPTDRALDDFLLGKLPDPDHAWVEEHLAECPPCQGRAAVVRTDTLTELLASAATKGAARPTPAPGDDLTPSLTAPTQPWDGQPPAAAEAPPELAAHPKYRVVRRLGSGGMGTVWLAEHAVMNRPVAVKVIRPDLLAKPGAADRFLREVRAAAKLHHPHIVTAFDAERAGDMHFLVMEFVEGETLADRLKDGPLPVAEACRAARDAARGLAAAHAAGLVHRDVKPANLIRAADGSVKVLDFGLAAVAAGEVVAAGGDGLTGAGTVFGTPDYIAPEQAADPHAADARADVYGLGCTLYHLLAGRPPFRGGSVAEKLDAHRTREPDPIPGLPAGPAAVLARMTAKDPDDRYPTAGEAAAALEPFCGTRRKTRRPWPAVAAGLLFAGLLAGAAGAVYRIQRDNEEIVLTTDDPDIEVVIRRGGELVRIKDAKTGQSWDLDTTKYQIGMADKSDGLKLDLPGADPFVLRRDGKEVLRITRVVTPRKSDRELILGTWRGVAAEVDGQPLPQELIDTIRPTLTFTADRVTARPNPAVPRQFLDVAAVKGLLPKEAAAILEKGVEGVYHLDPTKSPRTIDMVFLGEPRRTGLGLYALDGDTLKLCMSLNPDRLADRPAEFSSKGGVMRAVFTLKRQPAEKPGEVRRFEGHKGWALRVAFSPDGRLAFSTCNVPGDGLRVWDVASGRQVGMFDRLRAGWGLAVALDGRRVVCSDDRTGNVTHLLDLADGSEVRQLTGQIGIWAAVLLPDGKRVVTGAADRTIRVWDLETGEELRRFGNVKEGVRCLALSPDGRTLAAGHYADRDEGPGALRLWDAETGKEVRDPIRVPGVVAAVAFAADGRHVLTGDLGGGVRLWEVATGEQVAQFVGPTGPVEAVAFTPDGRVLSAGGKGDGALRVWDAASGNSLGVFHGPGEGLLGLAVAPDGRHALTGAKDQVVRLWRLPDPVPPRKFDGVRAFDANGRDVVWSVGFSPDGRRVLKGGGTHVVVFDRETGRTVRSFEHGCWSAAYSADGRRVVTGTHGGTVHQFDARTGEPIRFGVPNLGRVRNAVFSPDGKLVAASHDDNRVHLWDAATGQEVRSFPGFHHAVHSAAFTPDGDKLLVVDDPDQKVLALYDLKTGEKVRTFEGHAEAVYDVAVSADGRRAVSGGTDNTVRLWDLETGQELRRMEGHTAGIHAVAFCPDGRRAVSGAVDRTVRLWDLETGKELRCFEGHTDSVVSVAVSPDGRHAVSGGADKTVRLWRLPDPPEPKP